MAGTEHCLSIYCEINEADLIFIIEIIQGLVLVFLL